MPTILQLSDAHLSPRNGLFRGNLALLRLAAERIRPDLVVASGDLSLDGADRDGDLELAAELHRAFPGRVLLLPGNHDTGSHPTTMPDQPVEAARLARWRRICGPDRFLADLPGWRVVGLNTEIMGTGLAAEAEQAGFVAEAAGGLGDRHLALFLHKPVFVTAPEDPAFDYWSVPPAARPALAPLTAHPALRLVASGHLHLFHLFARGAVRYAWAPPISFVVDPAMQRGLPGERICGALLHRLGEDSVTTELLAPEGIVTTPLDAVRHETYPPR